MQIGLLNLWGALCAEFGWAMICLPLPAAFRPSRTAATSDALSGSLDDTATCTCLRVLRPRRSLATWGSTMALPYLCSALGLALLEADRQDDTGWCFLCIANIGYSLLFAPMLYRAMMIDTADCRAAALDEAFRLFGERSTADLALAKGDSAKSVNAYAKDVRVQLLPPKADSPKHSTVSATRRDAARIHELLHSAIGNPHLNLISLDSLQIQQRIGGGGFGAVHSAIWLRGKLPVAVKHLHAATASKSYACANMLQSMLNEVPFLPRSLHGVSC